LYRLVTFNNINRSIRHSQQNFIYLHFKLKSFKDYWLCVVDGGICNFDIHWEDWRPYRLFHGRERHCSPSLEIILVRHVFFNQRRQPFQLPDIVVSSGNCSSWEVGRWTLRYRSYPSPWPRMIPLFLFAFWYILLRNRYLGLASSPLLHLKMPAQPSHRRYNRNYNSQVLFNVYYLWLSLIICKRLSLHCTHSARYTTIYTTFIRRCNFV